MKTVQHSIAVAVRLIAILTVYLCTSVCASAVQFGSGSLPVAFEPNAAIALEAGSRIVISGTIEGQTPAAIVLRLDDGQSKDYASRMNDERTLPPGPFSLTYDTANLRATNGRVLNVTDIKRVILFINGTGAARVSQFATIAGAAQTTQPATAAVADAVTGLNFGTGALPVMFEPEKAVALNPAGRIDIAGTIDGTTAATVVLRIDDGQSTDYASRMNVEYNLGPGPFALSVDVTGLQAVNGRKLDARDIRRVILFVVGTGSAQAWHFAQHSGVAAIGSPAVAPVIARLQPPSSGATKPNEIVTDFGTGPFPIAFEPAATAALPARGHIEIAGVIESTAPVTVVLRIDDTKSTDYNSRMNDEKTLPPGPFNLSFNVADLRATNGRALDADHIVRLVVFVNGEGSGRVTRFMAVPTAPVPDSATPSPGLPSQPARTDATAATAPSRLRRFGAGRLPLKYEPTAPAAFSDGDEIHVEGIVEGTAPAAIALRVDDASSSSYPTRYNDERMIPPGPFRFSVGVKGLKTASGRTLNPASISRVILFAWQGDPKVTITRFDAGRAAALPDGTKGYSFGALDAAVPNGFERIGAADRRITGRGPVEVIRRPAPDPLVANGLRGVRRVTLPASGARVRVTVWSEDPGEWDVLPHPFERRIQVNGRDLVNEKLTADQWIAHRYLSNGAREHTVADDAWSAYGASRGNAASIDVDAGRDGIVIDLSGTDQSAYFINAVLIEPVALGTPAPELLPGYTAVAEQRAQWYREQRPVAPALATESGAVNVALTFRKAAAAAASPSLQLRVAPDTGASLVFQVVSDTEIEHPKITLTAPRRNGVALSARLWGAQYKLERDESVLRLRDDRLLANLQSLPLSSGMPRGYELWIDVPKTTAPGVYAGSIVFADGALTQSIPIAVTVLAATLPPAPKPAGFYLARAAHLGYFAGLTVERERQLDCDLDLMRGLGLTNTAPPISGLARTDLGVFAGDMRRASRAGVAPGWLIYNPLNDLTAAQGLQRAAATVRRLEELIKAQGLPEPLWSVADEPSNPDQPAGQLTEWVRLLRAQTPNIRLGGHLNTPSDVRFLPLFDTVIVNAGFGIDAGPLERLRASGKGLWLYNTWAPRQTAGVWLWRTAAERYVQWHARMPTADPFDPLDGREGDFQMIYPTADVCPKQPDIHRDLLRMAEGVVDQRWLAWLDNQTTPAARRLRDELRAGLPGPFADAFALTRAKLETLRNRIMDVAQP